MLYKDVIPKEKIDREECEICKLHKQANAVLPKLFICPICSNEISFDQFDDISPVGEENVYNENHKIEQMPIGTCYNCGERFALKPIPVIYNANHDIYYTGGSRYLTSEGPTITDEVINSITQYTDRIKAGETSLTPLNLQMWIEHRLNSIMAKWLVDNGFKY